MGILIAIRRAELVDRPAIWAILQPVFAAGETYAVPREWTEVEATDYWFQPGHQVFVAEGGGETVGTYFLQANHGGGGGHSGASCPFSENTHTASPLALSCKLLPPVAIATYSSPSTS